MISEFLVALDEWPLIPWGFIAFTMLAVGRCRLTLFQIVVRTLHISGSVFAALMVFGVAAALMFVVLNAAPGTYPSPPRRISEPVKLKDGIGIFKAIPERSNSRRAARAGKPRPLENRDTPCEQGLEAYYKCQGRLSP